VGASVWGMLGQVGLYCEVCYFYGVSVAHLRRLTWFGVGGWVGGLLVGRELGRV